MMNKGVHIETWIENEHEIIEMLADLDCLDIVTMRQNLKTIVISARTSLLGLFRVFKATFNRPEMRVYWSL